MAAKESRKGAFVRGCEAGACPRYISSKFEILDFGLLEERLRFDKIAEPESVEGEEVPIIEEETIDKKYC